MKVRICQLGLLVAAVFGFLANPLIAQVNVTTYHNDNARTGQNTQETILTPANVNSPSFGKLFSVSVDGWVYAQPLYLANVSIAGGTHNVVYVATEHDSVYALDADNGALLWQKNFIPANGSTVNSSTDLKCADLVPEVGITGTPVIDPATGTIYFVAKSKVSGTFYQYLHAVDVTTGAEKFGGPVQISGSVLGTANDGNGTTVAFSPLLHNQRAGLLLENNHVIIAWSGHCDISPWHGWVMSYGAGTLAREAIFNTTPNGYAGGVWMAGAGPAADANGNIYFATGNGTFDGINNFGDSIVKLGPPSGGSFPVLDYFTPFDQAYLSNNDLDVSSGGLILLPPLPNGKQLLVQQSKEAMIFLLDTGNMGKTCAPACTTSDTQILQEIQNASVGIWGVPAYWNGNVYWTGGNDNTQAPDNIKAFSFNAGGSGLLSTAATSQSARQFAFSAPVPAVSANGTTNGILWGVDNSRYQTACTPSAGNCQVLYAYDATNLATMLYNTNQAANFRDAPGGAVKFTTPVIANGKVYVGSQFLITAYGLLNSNFTATPTFVSPAPGTYTAAQSVVLADATTGASIYYTTNGSTPTSASTLYTGAIPVSTTTTIKAIAISPGLSNSAVASGTYTITASQTTTTPTFSPAPATYATAQSVTLSDATPGATIYYTLDGTTPSTASTPYSAAIPVSATTTVKAFAVAAGLSNSAVATGTYVINSNPVTVIDVSLPATANVYAIGTNGIPTVGGGFDGNGNAYSSALLGPTVIWSGVSFGLGAAQTANAVSAATISLPAGNYSTLYLLGAAVNGNQVNQAFKVTYTDGTTSTFTQSVSDWHSPQNYAGESLAVTMPYRLTSSGSLDNRVFNLYGYSFALNSAKSVQSITLPNNRSVNVVAIALAPSGSTTATPTFNPAAGTYPSAQNVTLSDATSGAAIYYTTNGTTPTTASTPYAGAITVNATTTIKAIAAAGGYNNSGIASGTYTIAVPVAATPAFSPAPGSYASAQSVTLSDATPGASIYYTLDGTTPTSASTPYTAAIPVSATTTINAIAIAAGYIGSAVASGTYAIVPPVAATPTFSPAPGTFVTAQSVSLADATPGAAIYYTLDGTTPTSASTPYTAAIPVSATTTIKAVAAAAGYTTSAAASGTYTISPTGTQVAVPLAGANIYGIGINGVKVPGTGLDGGGQAYSGTLLGTSATWGGIPFAFGTAGALDALTNATLTLPAGSFSKLWMLATGVNGNQQSQAFVVTYTDGTTTTFTQSLSDWFSPQNYAGESKALTEAYRLLSSGAQDARTFYVYGYGFALNNAKTVQSIKLPGNKNVVVLSMTLSP